ncbi:BnaCnng19680D [Brassica napus]|uniref:BnaCnng19680D protein n=1 Tax=Brassica napus TaxID=3708 RepID=A0A078IN15_BRANA|nr:BnaCnng19680D [Brassica napus]
MGLVRRIFSGKVVSRSSGSVYGKKKLLQFFFAGFCFSERWLFFAFSSLFRLCPIKTFLVKEDVLDAVLRLAVSRRNRWVRWSQFPACSVETIGGFVFAGDVFSVPVTVV